MKKRRIVVSLGANALGDNLPKQMIAVKNTVRSLADLVEEGDQIVISHGNTPQVGMIHIAMAELNRLYPKYTAAPMSVCSGMSQGYVGYDLQNKLRTELLNRGIYKTVTTLLTQVCVDPYDESFFHPSDKKIGRYMTEEEAKEEEKKGNHCVEIPGKGYRRVIASPKPIDIVEIDAIRALLDANQVVIACGGGGIPVLEQGNNLRGASAVIDKDAACAKMAELLDADELLILTSVDKVYLNYNTDQQIALDEMTLEEAKRYREEGQFEKGTMLPKIDAAIAFVQSGPNKTAVIAHLDHAKEAIAGKTGTKIHN